ncbi:MAG: hypothetical protein JNK74_01980 [Candidatus Hydrogenedentes bacterium]|nr:hypothetical protein [Candidatus Hydrogenedentota bacterium]
MDVIVDGASNYNLQGTPEDVFGAVGAVADFLRGQGRSVLSVRVDGAEISPDNMAERLKGKALADVGRLEIGSELTSSLVEACLSGLQEFLPELPQVCRNLAEVFQGEKPEEGFDPFVELAEIWGHIKSRESLVANALELELGGLEVDGKTVQSIHAELNQFLEEAEQALKDGDIILLADLLEYELAPRAELEVSIVSLLQAHIPASAE